MGETKWKIADMVLPVFAIIVTGWLAGGLGYISRSLADGLVHFAYNVAMPALLFITIAQETARNLLEWRFLLAFGGGSILCFALVFLLVRIDGRRDLASSTIYGMTAAMTNTGFIALPILHSIYGQPAVLPAAVATVFVAVVMFPLDCHPLGKQGTRRGAHLLVDKADRAQSVGIINRARSSLGDRKLADSDVDRDLYEFTGGGAHAMCALRDRAWPVGRGCAREPESVHRARRREARSHASDRLRPVCGIGARSALHDRCRRLCRRADCEDGVYLGR